MQAANERSETMTCPAVSRLVPGTWVVDPVRTEVAFIAGHFGFVKVRGRFTRVEGSVSIGQAIEDSVVEITIDMDSVESRLAERDQHLRSSDLFDVKRHPFAIFRSFQLDTAGQRPTLVGHLTMKGNTQEVVLDVDLLSQAPDPAGIDRASISASTTLNRYDWGIRWNVRLDSGVLLVSKEIRVEIVLGLTRCTRLAGHPPTDAV